MSDASELIVEALAMVVRECATAHDRARAALGARSFVFALDGDVTHLELDVDVIARSSIAVRTSAATLRALVEDRADFLGVLASGDLDVIADTDEIAAAGDAATWIIHGLIRCRSAARLLQRLINLTEARHG